MFTVYFKETTLQANHVLKNTEQPIGSTLNPASFRDKIEVEKGEVLPVMVKDFGDGRVYYTLYKKINNKVYTTRTLYNYSTKGVEVVPNTGGLRASEDVKKELRKRQVVSKS
jgi:hypothetical protein